MQELAIITSCDANYFPLAKGLILSLRAAGIPQADQQVCLIDIGCSESQHAWLRDHQVRVLTLNAAQHIPFPTDHLPSHIAAMAIRPFMRSLFPDFNVYLWIDADTWVQSGNSIALYHRQAAQAEHSIAICPLIDVTYKLHFTAQKFQQDLEPIYQAIVGEQGVQLSWLPVLSAGVFAMRQDSPVWQAWGRQLPLVYRQNYDRLPDALHLAEQTALNKVIYMLGEASYLDAVHNYHLCAGTATWQSGVMRVQPDREIGIVHLCALSTYVKKYISAKTFYRQGEYLSNEEWQAIAALHKSKTGQSP